MPVLITALATTAALIALAIQQTAAPVRGDLDGNGRGDLVVTTEDGALHLLSLNGHEILSSTSLFGGEPVALFRLAAATDLNADGLEDLVFEYNGQHDAVFSGDELGTLTLFGGSTAPWHAVAGGDLNGDGIGDLVFQYAETGIYSASHMDGTNVLAADYLWNAEDISPWRVVGGGDFNGDGRADLLLRDGTNCAYAISYLDHFIQREAAHITLGGNTDLSPWHLHAITDADGNGTSELVLTGARNEKFLLYLNGPTALGGDYIGGTETNYLPGLTSGPR